LRRFCAIRCTRLLLASRLDVHTRTPRPAHPHPGARIRTPRTGRVPTPARAYRHPHVYTRTRVSAHQNLDAHTHTPAPARPHTDAHTRTLTPARSHPGARTCTPTPARPQPDARTHTPTPTRPQPGSGHSRRPHRGMTSTPIASSQTPLPPGSARYLMDRAARGIRSSDHRRYVCTGDSATKA
jgi:hypothetical protein